MDDVELDWNEETDKWYRITIGIKKIDGKIKLIFYIDDDDKGVSITSKEDKSIGTTHSKEKLNIGDGNGGTGIQADISISYVKFFKYLLRPDEIKNLPKPSSTLTDIGFRTLANLKGSGKPSFYEKNGWMGKINKDRYNCRNIRTESPHGPCNSDYWMKTYGYNFKDVCKATCK